MVPSLKIFVSAVAFLVLLSTGVSVADQQQHQQHQSSRESLKARALLRAKGAHDNIIKVDAVHVVDHIVDEQDEFADLDEEQRHLQTATERVNIWSKLRESLGTSIVGFLLIICMPCVIWKNEGRHVRELKRIEFCKNEAVTVETESPSEDTVGRLVHFVGTVEVGDDAPLEMKSNALNVTSPVPHAITIKRTCYIWQKREVQGETQKDMVGGGETRTYEVREDWMTSPGQPVLAKTGATNSTGIWDTLEAAASGDEVAGEAFSEEEQQKHKLATALGMAIGAPHGTVASTHAHVGDFGLSADVIQLISDAMIPVPTEYIPDTVEGCDTLVKGSDGILRTFEEGSQPQNGDIKIVYEFATDGFECSFVVQQTAAAPSAAETSKEGGDEEEGPAPKQPHYGVDQQPVVDKGLFAKCSGDLGTVWLVRKGRHTLEEMVSLAKEDENKCHKILRVLCWVLLCAGWIMLFSPFNTVLSTLPILSQLGYFAVVLTALIVSCLCCLTVTAVAYIAYRPLLMLGILTLSLGIWGIVAWRLNTAAENGDPDDQETS